MFLILIKPELLVPLNGRDYLVVNNSHINTSSAIDTVAPCPPVSEVVSICDSSYNIITWISPKSLCGETDNVIYQIYYRPDLQSDFELIATQSHPDTTYIHNNNLITLAGQYSVAAIDSAGNISDTKPVIIDSCLMFSLPNVFTPDNDGINDIFYSYNLGDFIQRVDMEIFNRYGQLLYKTTNPDIAWDGRSKLSGKLVPSGVYYYICTVFEPRLYGEIERTLKGFIHVFSGKDNVITNE
jgi:gliding motility-associated-like protein